MWPDCIGNLSLSVYELKPQMPVFIEEAWEQIKVQNHSAPFPIRIVSLLGQCKPADYPDCPTLPNHHKLHMQADGFYPEGLYSWIDFDFVWQPQDSRQMQIPLLTSRSDYNRSEDWSSSTSSPMRMVFHMGDWDCNDGCWGVVWDRNTAATIATIETSSGAASTIKATSRTFSSLCKSHLSWMSDSLLLSNSLLKNSIKTEWLTLHYASESILERAVGLTIANYLAQISRL